MDEPEVDTDTATFAQSWVSSGLACGPLTDDDRARVVAGIRTCYEAAGQTWPDRVIWASSPTQVENLTSDRRRLLRSYHRVRLSRTGRWRAMAGEVRDLLARAARRPVGVLFDTLYTVTYLVLPVAFPLVFSIGLWRLAWVYGGAVAPIVAGYASLLLGAGLIYGPIFGLPGWYYTASGGVGLWFGLVAPLVGDVDIVFGCLAFMLLVAVGVCCWLRTGTRIPQVAPWLRSYRDADLSQILIDLVQGLVRGPFDGPLWGREPMPIWLAPFPAAMWPAGMGLDRESLHHGGSYGPPLADLALLRHHDRVPAEAAALLDALLAARTAWGWVPLPWLVVICEPPLVLRTEVTAGSEQRLHCATGPAVVWPDGTEHYYLHGTQVPRGLALGDWGIKEIHRERNSERRRLAVEQMGWATYVEAAELQLVASAPDPGNAPHRLRLYRLPPALDLGARVLLMTNGSPDRSGQQRAYAELVPAHLDDPVAAAAWQYGCDEATYLLLERRT